MSVIEEMICKCTVLMLFFSLLLAPPTSNAESVSKPLFRMLSAVDSGREPYAKLMQTIYEELGFKVSIIPTPTKRGIMLLNDEVVDADVMRLKRTVAKYDNVILVEPPLAKGYLLLLCHKGVPCDLNILQNKTVPIQTHAGILNLFVPGELNAQIIISEMASNTINMMEATRIFYALYTVDELILETVTSKFDHIKIKDVSGYHVINRKYAHLFT